MRSFEKIREYLRGDAARRAIASLLVAAECLSLAAVGAPAVYADAPVALETVELADRTANDAPEQETVTPVEAARLGAETAEGFANQAEQAAEEAEQAADETARILTQELTDAVLEAAKESAGQAEDAARRALDAAGNAADEADWAAQAVEIAAQEVGRTADAAQRAAEEAEQAARTAEETAEAARMLAEAAKAAEERDREREGSEQLQEAAEERSAKREEAKDKITLSTQTPSPTSVNETVVLTNPTEKPADTVSLTAEPAQQDEEQQDAQAPAWIMDEAAAAGETAASKAEEAARASEYAATVAGEYDSAYTAAVQASEQASRALAASDRAARAAARARAAVAEAEERLAQLPREEQAERAGNAEMPDILDDTENVETADAAEHTDDAMQEENADSPDNIEYTDSAVNVWGEVPDGVYVQAENVSNRYQGFEPREAKTLAAGETNSFLNAGSDATGSAEKRYSVLAAYDISLTLNGEEYQPEPGSPLTVTITDPAIEEGMALEIWHIHDDGFTEPITDFTVEGNTVRFIAESFSVYLVAEVTVTTNITTGDGNTYRVSVSYTQDAALPENAELVARELDTEEKENYVNQSAAFLGHEAEDFAFARAFDLSLTDPESGMEIQPASGVKVSIRLLDTDIYNSEGEISLLHFGEEVEPVDYTLNDNAVEFTAEGFSVYVLTGYTVDFHWGDYKYSIAGESEITLSALLEKLGVTEITAADVAEVAFSDSTLVEVEAIKDEAEQTTDWLLRSLAPFSTDEKLTLTLKNGKSVEIKVTDEVTLPKSGDWTNGTKGSGTWEIDTNGVLTISGTGEMPNYSAPGNTPWGQLGMDVRNEIKSVVFKEGITHLGNNMLTRSYNMVSVDASKCTTLKTVGTDLFKGTGWDPEPAGSSLESINFSGCNQLTTIGKQAFRATKLETVDFSGCSQLNSFGDNCFTDCTQIKTLNISGTKLKPSHITTTGAGFGSSKNALEILRANGCTTDFTTLDLTGWTSLQTVELSGCTNLNGMNLPNSVTTLDLSGCTGLASLTVPSKVTSLNVSGCTGLTSLDVSGCTGLTTLDVSGCTALTSLSVPGGVTTLDVSGTGLTSLDLSGCASLTELDASDCASLTSLTVPSSVTTLNVSGCTGLNSLNIPSSVTTLNASGCTGLSVLDLSETSLTNIDVSNNASLTVLKLPATVTALNVTNCPNLVLYFDGKKEDLPEGLIPKNANLISWGDYTYSIKKNRTATLDEIFAACGITAISSTDVDSVSVSDTSVLEVNDLTVKSLQSFTETQTLTVTLTNGMIGSISVICETLEESDNLNLFLDSGTVYSFEGESETRALSVPAIMQQDDTLNLTLSFSEIPEGQEGERQMKLSEPMKYTFPEGLIVDASALPDTVEISVKSGEQTQTFTASVDCAFNEEMRELTITGNYDDQAAAISAATAVSFTVPVSVQVNTVPHDYELGNSLTLSAVKSHNVKVSSFTAGSYNEETGTVTYTAVVEAENDLDFDGQEYLVSIADSATEAVGSYIYAHKEGFVLPEGKPATQVNGADVTPGTPTAFTGFPLTIAHMYEGDTITLTYTAKPQHGSYDKDTYTATAENTITITNKDALGNSNPSNNPTDDTATAAKEGVPCTLLTREYVTLDGSWAYWRVTVNPDGYTLNGGSPLTLADTFDDDYPTKDTKTDAGQSIDYASVVVSNASVTYDYSGSTGTFVIPDSTPVTITYRTRITAQPGEAKNFRGTAVLKTGTYGEEIASATAGVTGDPVVIYPSASDVTGSGNYMVKLYVYGDRAMQKGIEGVTFILLDANQRALEYKLGSNAGQPVTFTTGSDGYANIELHEEPGDVSIEKNTGYYLEMMQAVEGYQKDNTLYSFMITDDPAYSTGSFYQYYNGDTMKVRLYPPTKGLSVSIRFSGSYALSEEQQNAVTAVLQKLDENDHWVEVESHPYTDSQWGAIKFNEILYDSNLGQYQNVYRVVIENENPWDLPEYIHVETTYYSMVNTDSSDPKKEPQDFIVTSADDSVNVVIDNRYEDPQVTIVKMDKSTGAVLPGAVFTVYEIINGEPSGEVVFDEGPYTTDENGEIVIRGRKEFESEKLYGITETQAPELVDPDTQTTIRYLLPLNAEWHYFYFCNDDYLEPRILENLPAGATATNLTGNGDRITIDNQREKITVPVMKLWQGNNWPENAEVVVGLYRSIEGVEGEEAVCYDDGSPRTVTLNSGIPYNNTAFKDLPSRDEQNRNYIYSIKEESINGQVPLAAGYNQDYGISSAGVYIVRNKPATTLTVSKEWYDFEGNKVTGQAQSPVTFDVYRSSAKFVDSTPDDGITNADMTAFVGTLTRVREKLSFGPSEDSTKNWKISIRDLDRQDDLGKPYYYYILETVPSFGNELYEVDEDAGTVLIKNRIAPETVDLTVTKAKLVDDPRQESLNRDFEFTLKLQKDDTHPIRSWTVYTDAEHPENNLVTDWNGEAVFTLKPTDPDHQPTAGASITLSLPAGVPASVTETYNAEYTVATDATVGGTTGDDGRTFSYVTDSGTASVSLTYTNTLHVVCKVVDDNGGQTPFESLHSALKYIRDNPGSFTAPWTIYMLEDYTIPVMDVVEIQDGESLTLTTASTDDSLFPFKGEEETERAVITRGGVGGSMLSNAGTLNLQNIVLDGAKTDYTATGDGGLVYSSGTLNLNDKTTLRNSAASGKGGAVFVTGMTKTVGEEQTYVKGEINIVDGVEITGNSAPSASALYLNGTLNMTGGSITGNTGAADGAVVVESTGDLVNLSGSPVIFGNTKAQNKAANLYIGADSDNIINVTGITADAHIGVSAMDGHMGIGEQFASAEFEKTDNLNRFVNDTYGYRGKLRDGTTTNIVWDGLTIKIKKTVDPLGANANDLFTITLSSMSVVSNTYIIDGTLDYSVSAARQNRPGRIILSNVKNGDEITISPLPVGDYTIAESASNYAPVYTIVETGSSEPVELADGKFDAENNSSITVTNTRRLAAVNLTKTLDDRLKAAEETQSFNFTVKLTEADGTAVSGFELAEGIATNTSGVASFAMAPSYALAAIREFKAPVGATMTITETIDPNYEITASAKTIADLDEDNDNVFAFSVTDDGADITFANVRKMAEIELRKNLTGKVSAKESFEYTVTLTRADKTPAARYTMYRDDEDPENNIVTDDNGQATITFDIVGDENTKAITLTIPEGTKLVVAETEVKKNIDGTDQAIYTTKYSINGAAEKTGLTATINKVSDNDHSIVFNNTRKTNKIVVKNTVNGYSGNVVPFTYTATVTDWNGEGTKPEGYDDYDANGFTDGAMTFELSSAQPSQTLMVPYGATLTVAETFVVGYDTTVKRGTAVAVRSLSDSFTVSKDISPLLFTNSQLIGLKLVNDTSSELTATVTIDTSSYSPYVIYRVLDDMSGQIVASETGTAEVIINAGKTALLEIDHKISVTYERAYTVSGTAPAVGYYYTIYNEPSFHETANPAILRVYDKSSFTVKGMLRYSVADSTVTFTEQPLVSFDSNGGAWTTEMDGYHDRDGDRKVYQKAVDSEDKKVAAPKPNPVYPTAEETVFLGWTTDEDFAKQAHTESEDVSAKLYDFKNTTVTEPFTLYAIWARDPSVRTVTVKNALNAELTVNVTLTNADQPVADYTLYEDTSEPVKTDENGTVSFTLAKNETKNLKVPDGAKLVISGSAGIAYSTDFTDDASTTGSFTINPVETDGTVSFIGGIFKITDEDGNLLYDASGKPAVYGKLRKTNDNDPDEAFDAYVKTLYSDAAHTTPATPAAVKQLVDDYNILETAAIAFPNATMKLTTAGKEDADFPYVGIRDRGTIYRTAAGAGNNCFTVGTGNTTLSNIILDGGSENGVKIAKAKNGGLILMSNASGVLNVEAGTTMRNCEFAAYDDGNNSRGGAIYLTNGTLNVNAGLFSNLHAYQGGAICVTGGTLNVKGTAGSTQFEDCRSERQDGGAICYKSTKDLLIDGGTDKNNPGIIFTRCVAAYTNGQSDAGDGGAIFAYPADNNTYKYTISVKGCSFIECSAKTGNKESTSGYGGGGICAFRVKGLTVEACTFESCDTLCGGGAVVAMVKYTETVENETVTIKNCSFNQCNCKGQAGALGVYQDNNGATNSATKLSIIDSSFTGCSSGTNNGSGGAVQCYLPCMYFSGSTFSDCWAGKEGGAVNNFFGGNYTQEWSKSTMTVDDCSFIRCRAEDRYDPTALQHYGGGINTKAKSVTVTNSKFEDCVSTLKEGGALHIGGQGTNSTATITGSTFKNCTAKNGGGAVLSSHETLTIENSYFYGCGSSASNGGAVYHYKNSRGDSTQKNLTIKNSTFGVDPDDSESLGCSASGNGGAIWARATTSVTLEGLTINNCSAKNGGGIYLNDTAAAAKITGGAITDSTAESGSAVFVNKTATFSGDLSVSGNTVSTLNGGAIQTVDAGKLYFEGNVKVENNASSADTENNHDVLMQINGNTIINTTANGLGSGAHIGVYVSDPNSAYANHGQYSQPFGTYDSTTTKGSDYLDAFFNNRDSLLYGYQGTENDHPIRWGYYVCKITDADGNTLKRTNGRDAVYQRLSQAFDEFTIVKDDNGETGKAVCIKMLVEDYAIRQDTAITNFPAANITLTTASKDDTKHPYRGTEGTFSTIYRTNSENPLFSMGTENAVFQLKDITLDGRRSKAVTEGDYKLITATTGEIIVNSGTTLQYAKGDNGAAIDGVTVKINGGYDTEKKEPTVKIANCTATGSGGAIRAQSLTITNAEPNAEGKYGTSFMDCSAGSSGGAVSVSGSTMSITGALFQNCRSTGEGGAVCHSDTTATTSSVSNSSFTSCSATLSGGAVSSSAGTLTLTQSIFDNCRSQQNGGAISHTGTAGTTITGSNFNGCLTETTDTDSGFGGSVYSAAAAVTLNGGKFNNSTSANHGGALYCASSADGSAATVSGTSFESCSTILSDTCGGAIYSNTKALTLQDYTPEGGTKTPTTIKVCTAVGKSGAVHMATSGSTLSIKDSTVISNCYAYRGGAIYLLNGVIMNLTGSPEFTQNGYTSINGSTVNAFEGACIYLAEGSRINFKDSPKFSRNNITPYGENARERVTNGGVTDFVRQDVYLAGYASGTAFDTNAASIYVVGELTGDTIWVWPEQSPHRLANEQFAKIADGVTVTDDTLSHFRNALSDLETDCNYGEYLAGVQVGTDIENVYWDKMYLVDFKKKDNKGVAVPNAGFTLYKDLACTQPVATAKSADGETDTDSQGKLLARGMVEFTSVRIGAYYLKETTIPLSFKENDATYLLLVGTPYLSPNDHNRYLWEGDGPLNVTDAATLVARHTTDAGKFYGLFPLDENNKAVLRANLASLNMGIENIRNDFQVSFMKKDGNGDPLPGAAFTIYTQIVDSEGNPSTYPDGYPELMLWSRDGETYPAPVVSADGTSAYRDVNNKTLKKGIVYFRELPLGTYYLLETAYPERNSSGRRTYYLESDRVFKLDLAEDPNEQGKAVATLSEWKRDAEGNVSYDPLPMDGEYFVVSNLEVVCKLTDQNDNLLYVEGHKVRENKETDASPRLFPAIYATLEAGFADAQNRSFVYANGEQANTDAIKLKVLKDFSLTEPILYNSVRDITFTTAETRVSRDRYVFSTTRTTDTSRAMIRRAYSADTSTDANAGALITLASGADMTLQNIRLNGDRLNADMPRNGRAIRVTEESSLTVGTSTRIEYFKQEAAADSVGADVKGGAILMEDGTSLTVNGGYNRTAIFAYNEVNNERTEGNTGSDGGAIAVGANCTFNITNAQFSRNNALAAAEKKGNGGAVSINKTKDADEQAELPIYNVVFSYNTASYKGGAIRTAENCSLTVSNCTFSTNYANTSSGSGGEGGAIAVLSKEDAPSTLTITNGTTFTGNRAESGGAIKIGGYGTLTLDNVTMRNNRAVNGNGGAVSIAPGAEATLISGTLSGNRATNYGGVFYVEGKKEEDGTVTSGNLTITGGTITSNTTKYGGAVFVAPGGKATITNGTITGNTATTNGGAFYVHANEENGTATSGSLTISGGSVTKNTADRGSAVFVGDHAEATITDAGITDNTATANNGGAINVGGGNARLYFGGTPTVFDNFGNQGKNQQMNLVLNVNYNDVINTTADGLVDGVIGVFVIESNNRVFENHGLPGKPFGTFGDAGHANPKVFRSDHALSLYGVTVEEVKDKQGENLIYWVDVICKLTDDNDKILYQDISLTINGVKQTRKAQAVYARITDYTGPNDISNGFNALINGFNAAQGTLFVRDETQTTHTFSEYPYDTDTTVKLKMLKDYDLEKSIQYQDDRMVTFTTAETSGARKDWGDYFIFHTDRTGADGKALITRAFNDDSMIMDEGTRLTLTDITLDGAKNSYSANVNGGIVRVESEAALTITNGAALQNSTTTGSGGAVYAAPGSSMTMTGGTISGNTASGNGGAVYVDYLNDTRGTMTLTGGTINGNTAANGAGVYLTEGSRMYLSGNPYFGGTGVENGNLVARYANGSAAGNFVNWVYTEAKNGGKTYTNIRQDIFLADGGNTNSTDKPLGTLVLSGALTDPDNSANVMPEGSIWVWADGNVTEPGDYYHYPSKHQFALFADNVRTGLGDRVESTLHAFRNARDDEAAKNNTSEYLYGAVDVPDTEHFNYIYWNGTSGSRKVILRKVRANDYTPLSGRSFTVCQDTGTAAYTVKHQDGTTETLTNLTSQSSGVIWIGELPYGTYTIREDNGAVFTLTVGDDTVPGSRDGVVITPVP